MYTKETQDTLAKAGVYMIKNVVNGKIYIGLTTRTFMERMNEHERKLRRGGHENVYLQRAYNAYGSLSFQFRVVSTKSNILEEEQYWADYFVSYDKSRGYNMLREVVGYVQGHEPWNKGRTYASTNHLKVPKHFVSQMLKDASYVQRSEAIRLLSPIIYVYTLQGDYVGCWRSSKDLEEYSLTNVLPVQSRFSVGRMGKPIHFLSSCNINKCCSGLVEYYKGLKFSNTPLHQVTGVRVLDKNGEPCDGNTVLN